MLFNFAVTFNSIVAIDIQSKYDFYTSFRSGRLEQAGSHKLYVCNVRPEETGAVLLWLYNEFGRSIDFGKLTAEANGETFRPFASTSSVKDAVNHLNDGLHVDSWKKYNEKVENLMQDYEAMGVEFDWHFDEEIEEIRKEFPELFENTHYCEI